MKNWFRLDTAGLIFPAIMNRKWSNSFRMAATLNEEIDPSILQEAVNDLQPRFPSFYVALKKGFFWFYLQAIDKPIAVQMDYAYPLTHMSQKELKKCCIRVLYYKDRIAIEFFHSVTDGTGGSYYLATLLARYISLKHNISISNNQLVLDYLQKPQEYELEDSFYHNSCDYANSRSESNSYRLHGDPLTNEKILLTGIVDTDKLLDLAHQYHVSLTSFLSAILIECLIEMQKNDKQPNCYRDTKVTIPVNLRKLFNSKTLRNFVLTLNIGVNPRLGNYSLQEICTYVQNQLSAQATKQNMRGCIAANVIPQKIFLMKIVPVFIKNIVMSIVYNATAETKGSINISNIGLISLPKELESFVERFEFIVGNQKFYPNNCSITSYKGKTYINFIRNISQSELERLFFSKLVELDLCVSIECNRR